MPSRPTLIFCLCKLTFLLTTLVLAASWSPVSTSCWCTPRLGMSTCDDDDDDDNDDGDDDTHLGHLLQRVCAVPSLLLEHRPHQLTILGHCAMVGVSKAGWTVDSSDQEVYLCADLAPSAAAASAGPRPGWRRPSAAPAPWPRSSCWGWGSPCARTAAPGATWGRGDHLPPASEHSAKYIIQR